jgi:hypothetical protein
MHGDLRYSVQKLRYRSVGLRYDIEVIASISKFLKNLRYRVHNFVSKLANFDIDVLQYRVLYSIPVHFVIKGFKLQYRSASI